MASDTRWGAAVKVLAIVVSGGRFAVLVGAFGGGERLRVLVEQWGPWASLTYMRLRLRRLSSRRSGRPESGIGRARRAQGRLFLLLVGTSSVAASALWPRETWDEHRRATQGGSPQSRLNGVVDRGLGGWRELLFLRVTFPAIYNLLSYAAGSTRLPFRQYLAVPPSAASSTPASWSPLGRASRSAGRRVWRRMPGSPCWPCWWLLAAAPRRRGCRGVSR